MKKIHRFIGNFGIDADRFLLRDAVLVHQIRDVLKLKRGEKIALCDGAGREAVYSLALVEKAGIEVIISERRDCEEPLRKAVLYCSVLKRENFEYAVEKAVECGAFRIVPVISARTVKLGLNLERLGKIAREAAEQSGRGIVPEIAAPIKFAEAVKAARGNEENCFFDASGVDFPGPRPSSAPVGIWIGPEGGWEDSEIEAASLARFSVYSLGKRVMRAETAATVAVFLCAR